MRDSSVRFVYAGDTTTFSSVDSNDHILRTMQRSRTFYELDVLERIREATARTGRKGHALDVGAFIGTHSLYFARYCGFSQVLSYEANPVTFQVLESNMRTNALEGTVVVKNIALGAQVGTANILVGSTGNAGGSRVEFTSVGGLATVSTIDLEAERGGATEIGLIKIDVEGAEIDVLAGAAEVIQRHTPVLCVEVHTTEHLRTVVRMLDGSHYWIVDCLGWSPTYLFEPTTAGWLRRRIVNTIWILRTVLPASWHHCSWYLRRLGQALSVGRWNAPDTPASA